MTNGLQTWWRWASRTPCVLNCFTKAQQAGMKPRITDSPSIHGSVCVLTGIELVDRLPFSCIMTLVRVPGVNFDPRAATCIVLTHVTCESNMSHLSSWYHEAKAILFVVKVIESFGVWKDSATPVILKFLWHFSEIKRDHRKPMVSILKPQPMGCVVWCGAMWQSGKSAMSNNTSYSDKTFIQTYRKTSILILMSDTLCGVDIVDLKPQKLAMGT